jgi:hypothetical protein
MKQYATKLNRLMLFRESGRVCCEILRIRQDVELQYVKAGDTHTATGLIQFNYSRPKENTKGNFKRGTGMRYFSTIF